MFYTKNRQGWPMSADRVRRDAYWTFETKHFLIAFEPEPEEMDPADSFEFPEDVEFAMRNDPAAWFCAVVTVYAKNGEDTLIYLAHNALGGCSYNSFEEFVASHRDPDPMNRNCSAMRIARGENVVICDYFPGMVREAVSDTRKALAGPCSVRLRRVS